MKIISQHGVDCVSYRRIQCVRSTINLTFRLVELAEKYSLGNGSATAIARGEGGRGGAEQKGRECEPKKKNLKQGKIIAFRCCDQMNTLQTPIRRRHFETICFLLKCCFFRCASSSFSSGRCVLHVLVAPSSRFEASNFI